MAVYLTQNAGTLVPVIRKLRYCDRYGTGLLDSRDAICSKMGLEPTDTGRVQDLRMPCFWLCWARQHWQLVVQVTEGQLPR